MDLRYESHLRGTHIFDVVAIERGQKILVGAGQWKSSRTTTLFFVAGNAASLDAFVAGVGVWEGPVSFSRWFGARRAYPSPGERGSHSSNRLPSGSVAQPNRP